MPPRTPRLVVDRFSTVFSRFIDSTFLLLLIVFAVTFMTQSATQLKADSFSADAVLIRPWVDALLVWFVWKDPAIVLAVIVPLAIALQVAVHGLRTEISSSSRTGQPPRIREEEMRRVKVFSQISTVAASVIAVFTAVTVLDQLLVRSGNADPSMTITVVLCGFITATLCLDASRVATTQDLKERLLKAEALQQERKKRLRPLRRDVQSRRFVWLSSSAFFIAVVVVPGALLEYQDRPESTLPELVERVALVLVATLFLMLFLVMNFGVLFILTILPGVRRGGKVLILILLGLPSCLFVVPAVLGAIEPDQFTAYVTGFLPFIAFLSMLAAFFQATRSISSWITMSNFGFNGLLRFWAVVVLFHLFRTSNDHVSWLKHALHEPPSTEDLMGTSDEPKAPSAYTRLWLPSGIDRR